MLDRPRTDTPARIGALRAEMVRRRLDAFILPRFDAHQGEYIAPRDERFRYITGFSGSAGMAIITPDTVALFVDGRYTVQLANECRCALFVHHHLFDEPPEHWLREVAAEGWRVGFDPMHLPPAWFDRFDAACNAVPAKLVAEADNPVDAIWSDQPPLPAGRITPFPQQFAGKSVAEKCADLVAHMRKADADFYVDAQPDNIAWLLNVRGDDVAFNPMPHAFLVVARDGSITWLVDPEKLDRDVLDGLPAMVETLPQAALLPELERRVRKGQKVLIDPDFSPVAVRQVIEKAEAEAHGEGSILTLTKAIKNPTELEGFRACHLEDGVAWTEFSAWVAETVPARALAGDPVTECEAAQKILEFRQRRPGFLDESFSTISAAAGNAAMCHYSATPASGTPILPESPYLLDSGGQYETGTTDATRSFTFGQRPAGYDRAYTAVFKAFHALATLRFPPGTQGHHIDAICRRPLWDQGLDYDHGTGHGIGHRLSVHEHPQRIGKPHNPVDLKPGMVMSIEPGYYEAGRFGIRIENLFEIIEAEDGFMEFRNLTYAPIQTDALITDDLTAAEQAWLESYQRELYERLSPLLSATVRRWLTNS